jgi:hypothetical protein
MNFLKKIDKFIDKQWRQTCSAIFYLFNCRKNEVDIDWLNMHNNMIQKKGDKNE